MVLKNITTPEDVTAACISESATAGAARKELAAASSASSGVPCKRSEAARLMTACLVAFRPLFCNSRVYYYIMLAERTTAEDIYTHQPQSFS